MWLLLTSVTAAQDAAPFFVRLTQDHGLSGNTLTSIAQDARGFMWFGSLDGLNRYDGHEVVVYRHDPDDPRSLWHNYVPALFADRRGTLWVGTARGLAAYDPATDAFEHIPWPGRDSANPARDQVSALYEDADGTLWAGTFAGLHRLDRAGRTLLSVYESPAPVLAVLVDRHGDLWCGTTDGLARRRSGQAAFTSYVHDPADPSSLIHDEIRALYEDPDGELWIGTAEGLLRFDRRRDTFEPFLHDPDDPGSLASHRVTAIYGDRHGDLWIGTDGGGLNLFDRASSTFEPFLHDPSDPTTLGSDVIRDIYEDRLGDLWVATFIGGVGHYNRDSAAFAHERHHPDDPTSLSHSAVLSFFEEDDGTLWIGTEGGLNRRDPATGKFRSYRHDPRDPRSLSADAVLSILIDRRGRFWIGTYYGGLNRFDPESETFLHYLPEAGHPHGLKSPHIWQVFEDSAEILWLATDDGIHRFEPESEVSGSRGTKAIFEHHDLVPEGLSSYVWQLYEDADGLFWAATQGGLALYDRKDDAFRAFRPSGGLPSSEQILTILKDREGRLWLGTNGGGLNLYDEATESFIAFRADDGLPNEVVNAILEDADGRIWFSTNDGISRLDPRTGDVTSYDKHDGLRSAPFTSNAALAARDGDFFFGGTNGYNRFHPGAVRDNPTVAPIVLTELQLFNKPVRAGPDGPLARHITAADEIRLRHDQSVFTLSWAALSYRASDKNLYAYRLEGFDSDWIEAGGRHGTTYTNLDPGDYVFRVRGANKSGVWNDEGVSIRLVIEPALWERWWFRVTVAFVVFSVLFGAYWVLRTKNVELEARNTELERFSYTVSHDLTTPLVTIQGFVGALRQDLASGHAERVEHDLDRIGTAAREMEMLLSDLLTFAREGHASMSREIVSLSAVAREAAKILEEKRQERGLEIVIDPRMPEVAGDRRRLTEVFRNLLGNAISFTETSAPVEVGGRRNGREVLCWVRDDGRGIDARYHDKIFGLFEQLDAGQGGTGVGLALVKRIVENHGGRVWVESAGRGRGSTFYFTLPQRD